jgi:lipopolysaccharide heptosyltransferase I
VKSIAIVKLSSLGDVIHALPVAHALRRHFPAARVVWIVEARESPILKGHPDLDGVLTVDTRRWRKAIRSGSGVGEVWAELLSFTRMVRGARFDAAIDLQGLVKSGLITALTGATLRVGFARRRCREPLNSLFTNRRVEPSQVHVVDQYLSLLEPLGVRDRETVFSVLSNAEAEQTVDEFLDTEGIKPRDRLVALNPGAGRPSKRWPLSHYRRLAERLSVEAGVRVLLLWGPDERLMAREIGVGLGACPILAPPTTLTELVALLRRCDLMVAGDTGPLHLAAALGIPALGLYGPTRSERNGPYGNRCLAIQSPDGRMETISPDDVFRAAVGLLEK